jgi:hypothetical protein
MKLGQVNEAMDHRITEGSEFQWHCWDNARYLDYESECAHVGVIYNTKTQEVYQADVSFKRAVWWPEDDLPYRWTNPLYKDAYIIEAEQRKVDPTEAWDGVKWIELEVEEDFLQKAKAIFNGEDFDKRIQLSVDLDNDVLFNLAMEAHKRDITLNKMIEIVLQEVIDRHKEVD